MSYVKRSDVIITAMFAAPLYAWLTNTAYVDAFVLTFVLCTFLDHVLHHVVQLWREMPEMERRP